MNKYQEALNRIKKNAYLAATSSMCNSLKDTDVLQELIDKTNPQLPLVVNVEIPIVACPTCKKVLYVSEPFRRSHCTLCDQKIDWSGLDAD